MAIALYHVLVRKNDVALLAALDRVAAGPSDVQVETALLKLMTGRRYSEAGHRTALDVAVNILHRHAEIIDIRMLFRRYIESSLQNSSAITFAYRQSLLLLSMYGAAPIKEFCLDIARWHYGRQRPNGKLTIYDEQAIHNDLVTFQSAARPATDPVSVQDLIAVSVQRKELEHAGAADKIALSAAAVALVVSFCGAAYKLAAKGPSVVPSVDEAQVSSLIKESPKAPEMKRNASFDAKHTELVNLTSRTSSEIDVLVRECESKLRKNGIYDTHEMILDAIIAVYVRTVDMPLERFFDSYTRLRLSGCTDLAARNEIKKVMVSLGAEYPPEIKATPNSP